MNATDCLYLQGRGDYFSVHSNDVHNNAHYDITGLLNAPDNAAVGNYETYF